MIKKVKTGGETMIDLSKYLRTAQFLKARPNWTLDDLLKWSENELKKLEKNR